MTLFAGTLCARVLPYSMLFLNYVTELAKEVFFRCQDIRGCSYFVFKGECFCGEM